MLIYLVSNQINGKGYVGQTRIPLAKRWRQHVRDANNGSSLLLHRAIRKHGVDNFSVAILANCSTQDELDAQETAFISSLGTLAKSGGYNITPGGWGHHDRTGSDHPMFGKQHSQEARERMSKAHAGQGMRVTWCKRIEYKGALHTVYQLAKMAGIRVPCLRYRLRQGWPIERALRNDNLHSLSELPPSEKMLCARQNMSQRLRVRNQAAAVHLAFEGQTRTLKEWAALTGIPYVTIWWRFNRGKTTEQILQKSSLPVTDVGHCVGLQESQIQHLKEQSNG